MNGLMLHCGSVEVGREQLATYPVPAATETWHPVPHHQLVATVETSLEASGLQVVEQGHGVWGDGARYFGMLEVRNGENADDYTMVIGIRNSHDQSYPASLAMGAMVFVCDNLSFSGEVTIGRRHTRFIERDLPGMVTKTVAQLTEARQFQDRRFDAYRQTGLGEVQAHDLVVRALDAQVLPASAIPKVLQQWRTPDHPEFVEGGKTAWRMFNAFTETLKGRSLLELPARTQKLHGLLDAESGLVAAA